MSKVLVKPYVEDLVTIHVNGRQVKTTKTSASLSWLVEIAEMAGTCKAEVYHVTFGPLGLDPVPDIKKGFSRFPIRDGMKFEVTRSLTR